MTPNLCSSEVLDKSTPSKQILGIHFNSSINMKSPFTPEQPALTHQFSIHFLYAQAFLSVLTDFQKHIFPYCVGRGKNFRRMNDAIH